jgi:signal transduction histidine kinase
MIAPDTLASEFVFRRSSNGILIAGADGILEQINPAAAALLGVAVANVLGRPPERSFADNAALVNLFLRADDQILDVRLPRRRLATGIATTLTDGRRVVLLQDVTEQRELDARRDAFIATMAHDLRNPIAALVGYADLVGSLGNLSAEQERFLGRIQQTATKLNDFAADLVDLAWVEAGMPLKHVPIQLKQPIERVIQELTPTAEAKQITIFVSVQDPLPMIMGDPDRIQMVIRNLLRNAILYSDDEQTVMIHAWGDAQEAYCSVADRGFGISDEEIELVFDRMYRSKDERVQNTPGAGLGLTVARRIINRHGGEIWATSNPGKGSTFTLRLPAVNA